MFQRSTVAQNRNCSWVRLSYDDVQAQRENEEAERETERKLKDGWQVSTQQSALRLFKRTLSREFSHHFYS
jgi:hypothetical protein